jgi:hypothetical protein
LRKPAKAGVTKVRRAAESARAKRGEKENVRLKGKGRRRPETLEPQRVFAFNERRHARREEAERAAITDQRKTHLQTEAGKATTKHIRKITPSWSASAPSYQRTAPITRWLRTSSSATTTS